MLVKGLPAVGDEDRAVVRQQIMQQSAGMPQPTTPEAQMAALAQLNALVEQYANQVQLTKVANEIAAMDDVQQALPASAVDDVRLGLSR